MATYEYQCDQDGVFEFIYPMGTAPESRICLSCGKPARKIVSAFMVHRKSTVHLFSAIEKADKSRYEPEVVSSLPSSRSGVTFPAMLNPALAKLPRPDKT
ncbi:FmdB family zinc ribbon protein [Polynucleobacter brandtiae]|uniref:Putative FmdB family regulatory protein n=1 Tax=Polynucleobacter brandtiae TaxID=1938816 RepID=A0A2M8VHC9_9BURK|nr:zinc ribbon domain-containing protein [Polynucleobacter brandtiae]PJI76111.1 putative FmdB family regulatory protein [Polynucleobacter brandtiae]